MVDAFGPARALASLGRALREPPLVGALIESVVEADLELTGEAPSTFLIAQSESAPCDDRRAVALAPDLPTCRACLDELADPGARRHRYAFVACAHCGPRYTMVRKLPYDRDGTAMADFPLCPECAREYRTPEDRRFHAEATACPDCGPQLKLLTPSGGECARGDAALDEAIRALASGCVLAAQGVGGFHLACDASDATAISILRDRKRRPRKPLAVLVGSVLEAEKHALVTAEARVLLESAARPIVVLRRRVDSSLADAVAPGSPMVGLMLPYTALHSLLLDGFGAPLVMTSANFSGEPIAYCYEESREDLACVADAILVHDREILSPCDDSVVSPAPSGPIFLRRSRGYVPRPIRLERPLRHTILACGGEWGNTICMVHGERAWVSAHVGDMESAASVERLERTVEQWQEWLGVEPEVVAHDLHPGYESTRFARSLPVERTIAVQHHHAHMISVLAEHQMRGPALGLIWDGTGHGNDGCAWGGELLMGDAAECHRLATFRPLPLAGGERAIREPWRLALALLDDAFDGAPPLHALDLFRGLSEQRVDRVRALISAPAFAPLAHGVGRYLDAFGALLLSRPTATFQGELAQAVNFLASGRDEAAYPFDLDRSAEPWTIDLRASAREMTVDLLSGLAPSKIADRIHATLIAAGEAAIREALRGLGDTPPVVLGGGCFQNPLLVDGLERRLGGDLQVLRAIELPPGDGGLSLGQAIVADAIASAARGG
jgi:hydrogenase maturation protein HypF